MLPPETIATTLIARPARPDWAEATARPPAPVDAHRTRSVRTPPRGPARSRVPREGGGVPQRASALSDHPHALGQQAHRRRGLVQSDDVGAVEEGASEPPHLREDRARPGTVDEARLVVDLARLAGGHRSRE